MVKKEQGNNIIHCELSNKNSENVAQFLFEKVTTHYGHFGTLIIKGYPKNKSPVERLTNIFTFNPVVVPV